MSQPAIDRDACLKLCLLERDCPRLKHKLGLEDSAAPGKPLGCANCGGTGRIPLLDSTLVRVERYRGWVAPWSHRDCKAMGRCDLMLDDGSMIKGTTDCQGRGWVPTTDAWAYVRAAWSYLTSPPKDGLHTSQQDIVMAAIWDALDSGQDPSSAAFYAMAEMLLKEEKP